MNLFPAIANCRSKLSRFLRSDSAKASASCREGEGGTVGAAKWSSSAAKTVLSCLAGVAVMAAALGAAAGGGPGFYLTGRSPLAPQYGSMPGVGEAVIDPGTRASLMRMTDHAGLFPPSKRALIVYSRFSPINTSNEYFLVHGDNSTSVSVYRISDRGRVATLRYDGNPSHTIGEVNEVRWDYSGRHTDRVYFVRGMKFFGMDVLTANGRPVLLHDFSREFPEGFKIVNGVEGDSSNDSSRWAWMVKGPYVGGRFPTLKIFTYDLSRDRIAGVLSPRDLPGSNASELPSPNMVEVSPLGTKVVTHYGRCWGGEVRLQGPWTEEGRGIWSTPFKKALHGNSVVNKLSVRGEPWNKLTSLGAGRGWLVDASKDRLYLSIDENPARLPVVANYGNRPQEAGSAVDGPHAWDLDFTHPVKIGVGETHSGWAFDKGGREWFVSQNNRSDWIEARDILNGNSMNIVSNADLGWGIGFHFGKFYDGRQSGWFLLSTYSKNQSHWGDNQIIMVELKEASLKPLIWRVAPTYNAYDGKYRDEAPAALGHDGESVWWSANWGRLDGHGEVYRLMLPASWPSEIEAANRRGKGNQR